MDSAAREKIRTTPLTVGDILEYSCRYFWREMMTGCFVILLFYYPVNLLSAFVEFKVQRISINLILSLMCMGVLLLIGLCIPLLILWITRLVQQKCAIGTTEWIDAGQNAFVLWPLALWTMVLQGLIVFGLSLLLIVPGIIWGVYYTFSTFVVAQGSLWGKEALDYSKALVKGRWWITLGVTLLISLIVFGLLTIVWIIIMLLPTIFWYSNPLVAATNSTFFQLGTPLVTAPMAVWFTNLDYLHKRQLYINSAAVVRPASDTTSTLRTESGREQS